MARKREQERAAQRKLARAAGRAAYGSRPGDTRPPTTGPQRLASSHTPPPRIYLGMDVHKDSITLAILPDHALTPRVERLATDGLKLRAFLARVAANGAELRCCYEASYSGYTVWRWVTEAGHHCDVVAPSLIPQRPGDQRKTDSRDAVNLARLYRAGELVVIHVPTTADERARDLMRCRMAFQREVLRARHFLQNFTARRGLVYRETKQRWKRPHLRWLHGLLTSEHLEAESRLVFEEYLALLEYALNRRLALDAHIEALAQTERYAARVARLRCFRGIDTHAAMVLVTELCDWQRFPSARHLAAYLGLVPSEHSSGPHERRGRITKAGNSHCRHVLIQAAWHYRAVPRRGGALGARQTGQPATVIATSWRAQQRLWKRYHHLALTRGPQRAVVAVARELAGVLWSVMRELERAPSAVAPSAVAPSAVAPSAVAPSATTARPTPPLADPGAEAVA